MSVVRALLSDESLVHRSATTFVRLNGLIVAKEPPEVKRKGERGKGKGGRGRGGEEYQQVTTPTRLSYCQEKEVEEEEDEE